MHARRALALIVLAQLFGTSLWFSFSGVTDELTGVWQCDENALSQLG